MPPAHLTRSKDPSPPDKPTHQQLFKDIMDEISAATEYKEISYGTVSPTDGKILFDSLVENPLAEQHGVRLAYYSADQVFRVRIMPTEIHDVHQRWAVSSTTIWGINSLLNQQEALLLAEGSGTKFENFTGIYAGSAKEPDWFMRPDSAQFPRVVIESGWSESHPNLLRDKDLWMNGNTEVQIVILLKWSKLSGGRVKGSAEKWERGPGGVITPSIPMPIFPTPAPGSALPDFIDITKAQLFGQQLVTGQSPNTTLRLELQHLRDFASEILMQRMGLVPA